MLVLKFTNPRTHKHPGIWYYTVTEFFDGSLIWKYIWHPSPGSLRNYPEVSLDNAFVVEEELENCGRFAASMVTGQESEQVTGLHYPASMDRLREMIHENA